MKSVFNVLIGILAGLLMAGIIWVAARGPQGESIALRPAPTQEGVVVHVVGAVVRPGVYHLSEGSRVQDAVVAAGGFLAEADKNQLNLAAKLEDGQRLELPYLEGVTPVANAPFVVTTGTPSAQSGDLINVNTASQAELETLPGIGPTMAQRIIEYRTDNGAFRTIEDILDVPGIGPAAFEEIKDLITVGE